MNDCASTINRCRITISAGDTESYDMPNKEVVESASKLRSTRR
jgi:hypothetical protein